MAVVGVEAIAGAGKFPLRLPRPRLSLLVSTGAPKCPSRVAVSRGVEDLWPAAGHHEVQRPLPSNPSRYERPKSPARQQPPPGSSLGTSPFDIQPAP